ncbi:MAG: universal stress protein, partial [Bacteroidia bacterium]
MKTILVPTDFSKNSLNALDYAVEIAKLTKAKIILFDVYQIPIAVSEAPIAFPVDELEKECKERLREIEKTIQLKHGGGLIIESQCRCGFTIDEINIFSEENKFDLIVMGMR